MNHLITGANGFIGKWLMKTLPNAQGLTKKDCDIRDYDLLRSIIIKIQPTHIIHLAAIANPSTCEQKPTLAHSVNVQGTKNILRICKELNIKAVIMSSSKVYKNGNKPIENDELKTTGNEYIKTKLAVEELGKKYQAVIIRPFNQEGPGRPKDYYTSQVILHALKNKPLELWNPEKKREYMDVRDGAKAIQLISEQGKPGQAYNLSTGKGYTKKEYLELVEIVLDKKITYTITKKENGTLIGDNTKLKTLGWKQEYDIKDTIKDQAIRLGFTEK